MTVGSLYCYKFSKTWKKKSTH